MVNRCNVVACKYRKDSTIFKISHKNRDLKERWLKFLHRKIVPQEKYIFICEDHFEEKYLNKENNQRTRLRMSLNPVATIHPESLIKEKPSVFPNLTPLRKPPTERIFRPDEI